MSEEQVVEFKGGAGLLEGRLSGDPSINGRALLALHPHPLYGGSLQNNVVETAVRAGQACGFVTLRFNFRGVMNSEGDYDEGLGEQDDVGAAVGFLKRDLGAVTIVLAGYSFGACMGLAYCHRPEHGVNHLILISPPPFLLSDELSLEAPVVRKIILGERDEIAPPEGIHARISAQARQSLVQVIPQADHFFWGREHKIESLLKAFLNSMGPA